MQIRHSPNPTAYSQLDTEKLRAAFLIESLFTPGKLDLVYTDADRAIVGSAVPTSAPVNLSADAELRAAFFCERREVGVLNIGGNGAVEVDGKTYPMAKLDCLYIGRGSRNVTFSSRDAANPATFYLLSYPAHAAHPTTFASMNSATPVELGTAADANRRTIYKHIHAGGIQSCQLVMGFTQLREGAVVEHDAATYPHAPVRGLSLFRREPEEPRDALHGHARRDAASGGGEPAGGDFAELVDSLRLRHGRLHLLLGYGWRKPGL